jgi:hypothetical protein
MKIIPVLVFLFFIADCTSSSNGGANKWNGIDFTNKPKTTFTGPDDQQTLEVTW